MSRTDQDIIQGYTANGSNVDFSITFAYSDTDELEVYVYDAISDPTAPTLTLMTEGDMQDYTLTGATPPTQPLPTTVTFNTAPVSGLEIFVKRETPRTQPASFSSVGNFNPLSIETSLDHVEQQVQEIRERLLRAPVQSFIVDPVLDLEIPAPAAGSFLGWDANGTQLKNYSATDIIENGSATEEEELIGNNQTAAALSGLIFSTSNKRYEIDYWVKRVASLTVMEVGKLIAWYDGTTWHISRVYFSGNAGIDFDISGGGVLYTTDSMTSYNSSSSRIGYLVKTMGAT